MHLFYNCPFSQACWIFLDIHWDTTLDFQTMVLRARERFDSVIFWKVIIMAMWSIWPHRNNIISYGASLSFASWRRNFIEGMKAVTLRAKPQIKDKLIFGWVVSCNHLLLILGLRPCNLYIPLCIYKEKGQGTTRFLKKKKGTTRWTNVKTNSFF